MPLQECRDGRCPCCVARIESAGCCVEKVVVKVVGVVVATTRGVESSSILELDVAFRAMADGKDLRVDFVCLRA